MRKIKIFNQCLYSKSSISLFIFVCLNTTILCSAKASKLPTSLPLSLTASLPASPATSISDSAPPTSSTKNNQLLKESDYLKNKHSAEIKKVSRKTKSKSDFFKQIGKASWYGPGFHGKRTASGENFNMYALTAAHPFLPFSSYVSVTNRANNKTVMVKITDRGPYAYKRIIDLSYKAAKELNISGVQTVIVQKVSKEKALKWIKQKSIKSILKNEEPINL